MKKFIILVFSFFFLFALPSVSINETPIKTYLDNLHIEFDVSPLLQNNRLLVPLRTIGEALNADITWDAKTQTIKAVHQEQQIILKIGQTTAYLNSKPFTLDAAPAIIDGRTLIPLRFFSEALNCQVNWNQANYTVAIKSAPKKLGIIGFYALGDKSTSSWTNLFQMEYPEATLGHTDLVHELALGWYSLDESGQLLTKSTTGWQRPIGWENVLSTAQKYDLKTEMVVHATNKDNLLNKFLANNQATENLINNLLHEIHLYSGLNLNLEGLGLYQNEKDLKNTQILFTNFTKKLKEALEPLDKQLTLTLHAPNSVYQGYDYGELGEIADKIIVMAYEYGSVPEPSSKVVEAVKLAKSQVSNAKLFLGINIPKETADSLITKVGIAKRYNLPGIAFWRLGLLTPEMWANLKTTVIPRF